MSVTYRAAFIPDDVPTYLSFWRGRLPRVPAPGVQVTMKIIAQEVASETGVSVARMIGAERSRSVYEARREAIVRMRRVVRPDGRHRYSTPEIGRFFNRDHTTVLHALGRLSPERQSPVTGLKLQYTDQHCPVKPL